uniref:Mab-21-like HhH/H2TH-like domain-containing protein n=1 Tax=Strix occidentalis caurina TaxID=311401 RepID=A0A8D0ES95_STROC
MGSHAAARAQLLAEAPLAEPSDAPAKAGRRPCCLVAASPPLLPPPSTLWLLSPLPLPPAPCLPAAPKPFSPSSCRPWLSLLILLLKSIIQHPQLVGDELDEATRERMQQRAAQLSQEMTWLLQEVQELEQRTQKQSGFAWRALLFAALQQWQFWATAGLLVLLLSLCWWLRKRSPEVDNPRGHAFHLELGTPGEMPAKDSCVCVELECTCAREQLVENTLCFLHHPNEELRRNQDASLLQTLCTGSYLDVQKTALWVQDSVSSAWVLVLPSRCSCRLQLMNASRRALLIEMIFGVQRGDSDIFLSSRTREATFTPSLTWPESCAVAEAKFFRHVGRQAPHGSFHLRCLQLCARILVGTGFSSYALKTVVMHLLTTITLSDWCRRDFLPRLEDIMHYLRRCLEEKRLNHFFFGNENVPKEIILLPHLEQDPAAHAQELKEKVGQKGKGKPCASAL